MKNIAKNFFAAAFSALAICAVFAAAAVPAPAFAAGIVYVDFDRIYRDSQVINDIRGEISAEFRDREDELKAAGEEIRALKEEMEKEALILSDAEKGERAREIDAKERNFLRDRGALREDIGLRFQERRRAIDAELERVIKTMAEERKYDMVLNPYIVLPFGERTLTHNVILYSNETADITNDVIKFFDEKATFDN